MQQAAKRVSVYGCGFPTGVPTGRERRKAKRQKINLRADRRKSFQELPENSNRQSLLIL
jgi:hypothetical protein